MPEFQDILDLLEEREREFRSWDWQPERAFEFMFVRRQMRRMAKELVDDVQELNLEDLPDSGNLRQKQREMWWAWEEMVDNRHYDQATFLVKAGEIVANARHIFKRLKILKQQGFFQGENDGKDHSS